MSLFVSNAQKISNMILSSFLRRFQLYGRFKMDLESPSNFFGSVRSLLVRSSFVIMSSFVFDQSVIPSLESALLITRHFIQARQRQQQPSISHPGLGNARVRTHVERGQRVIVRPAS
ncbi:hypothetical protein ACJQWK_07893 [Exserohilum turcicum]